MSSAPFRIMVFSPAIDRTAFDCASAPLNSYLQKQLSQDIKRRITACFLALDAQDRLAGFYTLAATSVPLNELPLDLSKKLPRYPSVPAVRLGRLAVDVSSQKQGLAGAMLADALIRSSNSDIAAYALFVDAKDDKAADFYRYHGFIALPDHAHTLFLPLASIAHLVAPKTS